MFTADALTFAYPSTTQTYRFSLLAEPGTVTAISGPSGSGKSTLLDLLAGFLQPASGRIVIDERDITTLPPEGRPISLLLQSESLFDHLTAARNVALGLPPKTSRSDTARAVAAALLEVGLEGTGNQIAATLSGGQKQRVALARTLLRNRPVLLLDEPFSALDDQTRTIIRTLVLELTQRHRWHTLLVSHHADDVQALATRRYRLDSRQLTLE